MIKKISFLTLAVWTVFSFGQTTNKSPYSFFGIGENNQQVSVSSAGMGGISVALNGDYELNFANPALLSSIQFTLFDVGSKTNFLKLDDGQQTQNSSSTSLSYMNIGFPITPKMGFMIGLQPNSNVGYNIVQEIFDVDNVISEANIFNGNGGSNRLFMGLGYEIYDGLSLGVEGETIFGTIENNVINQRADTQLYTRYRTKTNLSGYGVKIGAAYQKNLKNGLELKLEGSAKLQNDLQSESSEHFYSFLYSSSGVEIPRDTMIGNDNIEGKITRPLALHTGIGIGKPELWYIGVEYNAQNAWIFDSVLMENSKISYTNRSQISMGGYWLPKKNSISSYWQRVVYRLGARMETPGIAFKIINTATTYTDLKDFGISFGLGLPVGNQLSKLNLSIEYGKRGQATDGLIQENYFNLRIGLNLAEKWFQKNKIN